MLRLHIRDIGNVGLDPLELLLQLVHATSQLMWRPVVSMGTRHLPRHRSERQQWVLGIRRTGQLLSCSAPATPAAASISRLCYGEL